MVNHAGCLPLLHPSSCPLSALHEIMTRLLLFTTSQQLFHIRRGLVLSRERQPRVLNSDIRSLGVGMSCVDRLSHEDDIHRDRFVITPSRILTLEWLFIFVHIDTSPFRPRVALSVLVNQLVHMSPPQLLQCLVLLGTGQLLALSLHHLDEVWLTQVHSGPFGMAPRGLLAGRHVGLEERIPHILCWNPHLEVFVGGEASGLLVVGSSEVGGIHTKTGHLVSQLCGVDGSRRVRVLRVESTRDFVWMNGLVARWMMHRRHWRHHVLIDDGHVASRDNFSVEKIEEQQQKMILDLDYEKLMKSYIRRRKNK